MKHDKIYEGFINRFGCLECPNCGNDNYWCIPECGQLYPCMNYNGFLDYQIMKCDNCGECVSSESKITLSDVEV